MKRLFHKRIDPYVKRFQPKNKPIIECHYTGIVDNEEAPPPDCPAWALSEEARERYNILELGFDADYDTGEEEKRKKKKKKRKHQSSE